MDVAQPGNTSTSAGEKQIFGSVSIAPSTCANVPLSGKSVNCLFCYSPVLSYNGEQTKIDRRLTIRTAERMFLYVCQHLEIDKVLEFHETRKSRKEGVLRLLPGNLPLCTECRLLYYRKMYDAFVDYELAMAKFHENITLCLTKAIAKSAINNTGSVTVETDVIQEGQDEEISNHNVHEVMKLVKQFRKKVVDKNPYGYSRNESFNAETLVTTNDSQNVISTSEVSSLMNPPGSREKQPETSECLRLDVKTKKKISNKGLPVKYYAVKQPAPGVIHIISTAGPPETDRLGCRGFVEQRLQLQKTMCKFCQKVLSDSPSLTRHMVTEHGMEKPLKCSNCAYRCFDSNSLSKHAQTHLTDKEREKPYQCEECGKNFRLKSSFKNHMDEHAGNRQLHTCEICLKQFNLSSSRQLCIDKHNGIKRHQCSFSGCGKRFLRKEVLKIHERTHTGEKPFKCHICSKCFSQRSPLQIHIKKIHSSKNDLN